jgi:hypothetical protein
MATRIEAIPEKHKLRILKFSNGRIIYRYRGFDISRHGYYHPDKCVWWEGIDQKTGCADFHATTRTGIIEMIDRDLLKEKALN